MVALFDPFRPGFDDGSDQCTTLLAKLRPAVVTAKYSKISGPLLCSSNANEPSAAVSLASMSW